MFDEVRQLQYMHQWPEHWLPAALSSHKAVFVHALMPTGFQHPALQSEPGDSIVCSYAFETKAGKLEKNMPPEAIKLLNALVKSKVEHFFIYKPDDLGFDDMHPGTNNVVIPAWVTAAKHKLANAALKKILDLTEIQQRRRPPLRLPPPPQGPPLLSASPNNTVANIILESDNSLSFDEIFSDLSSEFRAP